MQIKYLVIPTIICGNCWYELNNKYMTLNQGSHWHGKVREKIYCGQGKIREIIFPAKVGGKSGNLFKNAECRESLLLCLSMIENVCHNIHQYERSQCPCKNLKKKLFQTITCFFFTFDIDLQSVAAKMFREISLKSGKSQGIFFTFFEGTLFKVHVTWYCLLLQISIHSSGISTS